MRSIVQNITTPISLNLGYNLLRSVLALTTLFTLLFNYHILSDSASVPLKETNLGSNIFISCDIYTFFGFNLGYFTSIFILLCVVSGFFPMITSILHFYVSLSFNTHFRNLCDGGDYLTSLVSFLLIPIFISDTRKNSWVPFADSNFYNNFQKLSIMVNYHALRLLFCLVYFHATVGKFRINEWYNGTAIYYFLNDPLSGNAFLIENEILKPFFANPFFIALLTWGTLIIEALIALMLFCDKIKIKRIVFYLGFILHILIIPAFFIPAFSIKMIACLYFYLMVIPKEHETI